MLYFMVGSNGSSLVYGVLAPMSHTASYYSVPTGTHSSSATLIATVPGDNPVSGYGVAGLNAPSPSTAVSAQVFLNGTSTSGSTTTQSSMALKPDGTIVQTLMANSSFRGMASRFSGTVFQLQGITDTDGYDGGGSLYDFNILSGVRTPYTISGGTFVVPANNRSSLSLKSISNNLGAGSVGIPGQNFVYDVTTHTITPVGGVFTSLIL